MSRVCRVLLPLLVVLGFARAASAQASAQDKAIASRLFDNAVKLMAAGKAKQACPKFADSQRLDPQLGTLLHLGECYATIGKTASAWACFRDAREIANNRNDPREPKIKARLAQIEKKLANIVVTVGDDEPSGLEVRRDGEVVSTATFGVPVPVDPGTHKITATAPGHKPWSQSVDISAEAGTTRIAVPTLESAPAAAATAPSAAPAGPAPANSGTAPASASVGAETGASSSSTGSTRRILGWSAVGVGGAGLIVGVVFQLQRSSKLKKRDAICPSGTCPASELAQDQARINSLTSDARSAGTISTIGFVAGGVLAAGGLVLVLTAPHAESKTAFAPLVGPGLEGAVVRHVW